MWYGLKINGILQYVSWFRCEPLIWDFHSGYFSDWEYEVVEVNVAVVGVVPARM